MFSFPESFLPRMEQGQPTLDLDPDSRTSRIIIYIYIYINTYRYIYEVWFMLCGECIGLLSAHFGKVHLSRRARGLNKESTFVLWRGRYRV